MKVEEHAMWVFVPFMLPYRRPSRRCQPMRCLLRLMISAVPSVGPLSFLSLDSQYRMFQGNHCVVVDLQPSVSLLLAVDTYFDLVRRLPCFREAGARRAGTTSIFPRKI